MLCILLIVAFCNILTLNLHIKEKHVVSELLLKYQKALYPLALEEHAIEFFVGKVDAKEEHCKEKEHMVNQPQEVPSIVSLQGVRKFSSSL